MTIVVSDPILTWMPQHVDDLQEFYAANKAKHGLIMHREVGRPLHRALANAARKAIEMDASHVLFTEQDHWGYPLDGLDRLLAHNKDVVGFVTHYRCDPEDIVKAFDQYVAYPFAPMCMRKINPDVSMIEDRRNLRAFTPVGLERTDLLTWAFTLVKTDVLRQMLKENLNPFKMWGRHPPDSYFCEFCDRIGVEKWVDGTTMIEHGHVPNAHLDYYRSLYMQMHAEARKQRLASFDLPSEDLLALCARLNEEQVAA